MAKGGGGGWESERASWRRGCLTNSPEKGGRKSLVDGVAQAQAWRREQEHGVWGLVLLNLDREAPGASCRVQEVSG